ncbi:MAG: CPBP family intramembrane glutamic endopeptidase [Pyrinomonadaceae bacterium]
MTTNEMNIKPSGGYPWRLFWLLFVAAIASALAIVPAALELMVPVMKAAGPPPMPLPLLIVVGVVQNLSIIGIAVGLGVLLSRKIGLRAPLLEGWLNHEPVAAKARASAKSGIVVGVLVGVVVLAALLALVPRFPQLPFVGVSRIAVWKRFLMCFYGGIYEEILTRLFLLSLFAWVGMKLFQKEKGRLSGLSFWLANILVAILFGLGHLPSASLVMPITPMVVAAALLLNGVAGIAFGYLYRKRGLESAMMAHFCADFVVYVLGVAFLRFLPLH